MAINLVGSILRSLHHNKPHQSGFSLMRLRGNRASSVPGRRRQWGGRGARENEKGSEVFGEEEGKRTRRWEIERIDAFSYFTVRGSFLNLRWRVGRLSRCGWADRRWQRKERRAEMGVEGCLSWESLWDQDLQRLVSLCSADGLGSCT